MFCDRSDPISLVISKMTRLFDKLFEEPSGIKCAKQEIISKVPKSFVHWIKKTFNEF